jgi:hypothetical protein
MKDIVAEYLAEVRDELYRLADDHDICFEQYSEECQFDKMREAGDLLDEIVSYRQPVTEDWDSFNQMHKEMEIGNE